MEVMFLKNKVKIFIILIFVVLIIGCSGSNKISVDNNFKVEKEKIINEDRIESSELDMVKKVENMTLEEKINQMMMISIAKVNVDGNIIDFTEVDYNTRKFLTENKPGGIILFKNNMINEEQTRKLTSDIKAIYNNSHLIIGTDEEGGIVRRIPIESENLNANEIGKTKDIQRAYKSGDTIGKSLKKLGINVDFAPVVDINTNPNNPVIGVRAYSNNAEEVAKFAMEFIRGLRENNILSTAKHFPGHGDTVEDSHVGLPKVEHSKERLENVELYPFKEAIKNNVDMIMVGHLIVPSLDDSNLPASLSKKIITDLLKEELKFNGIVITDAMNMGAIKENFDYKDAAVKAINAGNDIILMPIDFVVNESENLYTDLIKYVGLSVKKGEISEERINEAVIKILRLEV